MASGTTYKVMLSSTYEELAEHREAVSNAMIGQQLLPVAMEYDSAMPGHDLIAASLAKVDEADAYVGLISYRYGQRPKCPVRNPANLSLTELEFRRALARAIPICMFIMHPKHQVPSEAVNKERGSRQKFKSFLDLAKKDRIYAEFESVADLKAKAIQSLVKLRDALDERAARGASISGAAIDLAAEDPVPIPPIPYEKPKYIPTYNFVGRQNELNALREWARATDPVLVFEAIGGMGKSMLTWQWMRQHAPTSAPIGPASFGTAFTNAAPT